MSLNASQQVSERNVSSLGKEADKLIELSPFPASTQSFNNTRVSPFWECKDPVAVLVDELVYAVPKKEILPGCTSAFGINKHAMSKSDSLDDKKILLNHVNMIARPGEFLAIVGPSGSGKTTLLNVLAMRSPSYRIPYGSVTFNGQSETKETVKSAINYVMAHDKLLPYLTVHESLLYAAALKLPYLSEEDRRKRVEQVLEDMCLKGCRNNYIGGEWRKGISTGELKRVAIGVELLDEPSVLILDEPTSGLDSALSAKIVELLVREARRGRTIIATVHQPSSQVFAMFDKILLLTTGRVIYHGQASEALNYFSCMGYSCSKKWNPSDFLLDLISPQKALLIDKGASLDSLPHLDRLALAWDESEEAVNVKKEINATSNLFQKEIENNTKSTRHRQRERSKRRGANWWHEVAILWKRISLNSLRNPLTAVVILLVQAMQGLILGGIFFHQSTAWAGPQPVPAISPEQWNSPWLLDYNFGISNIQDKRPILAMYEQGVDGNGSYIIGNSSTSPDALKDIAVKSVDQFSTCLYRKYNLPDKGYLNLTDLYLPAATHWDNWEPHRMYSNLMGLLQIFDYKYSIGDGHDHLSLDFLEKCKEEYSSPLDWFKFYLCLMQHCAHHVDPFFTCAGLPPLPTGEALKTNQQNQTIPSASNKTKNTKNNEHSEKTDDASTEDSVSIGKNSKALNDIVAQIVGPNIMQLINAASTWVERSTKCSSEACRQAHKFYRFLERWVDGTMQTIMTSLNLSGCLFFVSTILGFASYDALLTFPQERALFNRESANGLYRPSSYYIAKNIADLPFQLGPSLFMSTIYYFMVGFDVTATQFLTYFAICILTSFCAYGFGYMVSAVAPRMEVALLIAPLTLVIWLVLAGFFLRDGDIPVWINWFKYLSFYRWSFFSFIINQFPPGHYFGTLSNGFILALSGVTETNITKTCVILTVLGIVYRTLGYIFLATTNRRVGLEA